MNVSNLISRGRPNSIRIIVFCMMIMSILCSTVLLPAQNYLITFTGSGAASQVTAVHVANLSRGTTTALYGTDTLHLVPFIGVDATEMPLTGSGLEVYPNPSAGDCRLVLYHQLPGEVVVNVYGISGEIVAGFRQYETAGRLTFRLSGLNPGVYLVNAASGESTHTAKVISAGSSGTSPTITLEGVFRDDLSLRKPMGSKGKVQMEYTDGEILLLRGFAAIHSRIVMLVPAGNQVVDFRFIPCTDEDGNHYPVVGIGGQVWMAENLRSKSYLNGVQIPEEQGFAAWSMLTGPAFCHYDNDGGTYGPLYGMLYNHYAVTHGNMCPAGWHVPTDTEWTALSDHFGGLAVAGGLLKQTGATTWFPPNTGATNESGFTALPGGNRSSNGGVFSGSGVSGRFWSSSSADATNAYDRNLRYDSGQMTRNTSGKAVGAYLRCVLSDSTTILPVPVADFTANDTSILITDTVYFTDLSANNPTSWHWSFGDGNTSILQHPAHRYAVPGNYSVTLIAASTWGFDTLIRTNYISVTSLVGIYPVYDIDGNGYDTVHIGTQVWMKRDLRTTRLNDGSPIPNVTVNTSWSNLNSPALCWYNNDSATYAGTYGALYNFFAVATGKLCPTGWHVASDTDWTTLTTLYGGGNIAGAYLKEDGYTHWNFPNTGAMNTSGFTALPGGRRNYATGAFYETGDYGYWWTSSVYFSTAWYRRMRFDGADVLRSYYAHKFGFSVRCVSD